MRYDAFISYSHAADGKLAPALQAGLRRFAKPWHRRRALWIFRDQTSLSASPELWTSIQQALADSRYFILLASPEAAASPWVQREVEWWLQNRSPQQLLIVLTSGQLAWDSATGDFDWQTTDALPPQLRDAFAIEPLWVDLRWVKSEAQLSAADPRFQDAVADLAAPLRGMPKDDLIGEDIRQHQRTRRLAGAAIAALSLLLVAAAIAAFVALQQRDYARAQESEARHQAAVAATQQAEAERERANAEARRQEAEKATDLALSRQLAAQAPLSQWPDLAFLLALEADYFAPGSLDAFHSLVTVFSSNQYVEAVLHGEIVQALAVSDDGDRLAVVDLDGVKVYDLTTSPPQRLGEPLPWTQPGIASAMAFRPDGKQLAVAGASGVTLWDLTAQPPVTVGESLASSPGDVRALAFSPDGSRLAVADANGIELIPLGISLQRPIDPLPSQPTALAFTDDGENLIAADKQGMVERWNLTAADPTRVELRAGDPAEARSVALGLHGRLLAVGGDELELQVVGQDSVDSLGTMMSNYQRGYLMAALGSGEGARIAGSGVDGTVVVWNLAAPPLPAVVTTDQREIYASAVSADGRRSVLVSPDRTIQVYRLSGGPPGVSLEQSLSTSLTSLDTLQLNADGSRLAMAGDGVSEVWDLTVNPAVPLLAEPLVTGLGRTYAMAFNDDATRMAVAGEDGMVQVWSFTPDGPLSLLDEPLQVDRVGVYTIAFSENGSRLVTVSLTSTVAVWDLGASPPRNLGQDRPSDLLLPTGAVLSPDESRLVVSGHDGSLILWDLTTAPPAILQRWVANTPGLSHKLSLSADGTRLATAGESSIGLWDVRADPPADLGILRGDEAKVRALAFGPNPDQIASIDSAGSIALWETSFAFLQEHACGIANRNFSLDEWRRYVGSEPYHKTCPDLPGPESSAAADPAASPLAGGAPVATPA